jgi:hypothetical protein
VTGNLAPQPTGEVDGTHGQRYRLPLHTAPGGVPVTAYSTRHWRVREQRGPAKFRKCVHCAENGTGKAAYDWAHVHGTDPEEVMNYVPLCRSCHIRYDRPARPRPYTAKTKALLNRKRRGGGLRGYRHTPEAIEKIRATSTGRRHTAESIARMSADRKAAAAARGPMSASQREQISASLKGNTNATGTGRRSGQALENMRAGQQRRREREQAEKEAREA